MPAVLVTGAGRGIGRAITLRLAADGWDVYAGVRKTADGEALKTAGAAGRITPVVLDISATDDLAALATALPDRLDALVNNAGVVVGGPIEAVGLDDLRRQLEVNVTAQVAVTQALLPRLRASRGRVVFVSSVSGRVSTPFSGAYNASKFALEAIADSLRVELRPWKIAVSLVEPGAIDTDIWRGALDMAAETEAAMGPEVRELYAAQVKGLRKTIARTQRQAIAPEKVADAVHSALTAARPRARYVVGMDARVQLALKTALPTRALDLAIARLTGGR
jgi:NAD(P)-dependent dehydrogenase (short-subunit alcohol dehydrogenase family)